MRITIHFMGQIKHAAGVALREIDLASPCSVLDCLRQLPQRADDALGRFLLDGSRGVSRTILVFLGEEQVEHAESAWLTDGDVLTVLSPIAGG